MPNSFNFMFNVFPIIFAILFVAILVFGILLMASPKFRGKLMSRNIKAMRHMTEYSKEDLEKIGTNMGNTAVNVKKNILDENGDVLKDMEIKEAGIKAEGIKIKTKAFKDGLTDDIIYCKQCGKSIENDSKFCKHCGERL